MSDPHAPWLDDRDLPKDLATALRDVRREDASAAEVARLHARLAPVLGWPDPGAVGGPVPDPVASSQAMGAATAPAAASVPPAALGATGALAKLVSVPWLIVSATVATSGAFGWLGYQQMVDSPPAVVAPSAGPRLASSPPSATPATPVEAAPIVPEPSAPAPMAADRPVPPRPRNTAAPSLEDEARLLKHAQAELASAPAAALRLTQEHARRFRHGVLAQERDALAIEALARLGRTNEARQRLQRFHRDYPGSPHARRAAESLTAP